MKTRHIRINDAVARTAADVIRSELSDPRIGTVVSVIRAEVTADLKFCKIWVSILDGQGNPDETMQALTKASGFIRRRVAEVVNLRHTPELTFIYDDSIAYGMRMRKLIDEANK
ncbi:MAG: 30S ribosome-binding factor RbfA [Defluviitaleaceae bacterium]|nr:30S ribosome-binding factor RbfA [Defluviitaleaceae bacterium]MCL2275953.1 30S ribosome-binding factor RbfA [Defluviitaleaceae bacterium]